ncbi:hypothetical protein LINPERHAP2_LOCUS1010 [Linum perenne]
MEFEVEVKKLNAEQKVAYDRILESVNSNAHECFFIDGFGGTGKTFLWRVISMKLGSQKKVVLCVASSGIAALLMPGGRTAHSRFHILIDIQETSTEGCTSYEATEIATWIVDIGDGVGSTLNGDSEITVPTILAPLHETVSLINYYMLTKFNGDEVCYYSSDTIQTDGVQSSDVEAEFPTEFLNSMKIGNFPEHQLKLKTSPWASASPPAGISPAAARSGLLSFNINHPHSRSSTPNRLPLLDMEMRFNQAAAALWDDPSTVPKLSLFSLLAGAKKGILRQPLPRPCCQLLVDCLITGAATCTGVGVGSTLNYSISSPRMQQPQFPTTSPVNNYSILIPVFFKSD